MNKGLFMLWLLVLFAIPISAFGRATVRQDRVNVLFLVADDLNSWLLGDTNRYAGKVVAPNLHRLADSGVLFTLAYTAAPVCSPSRTAFFSGVAPWKSGHYHNTPGANISEPLNSAVAWARVDRGQE